MLNIRIMYKRLLLFIGLVVGTAFVSSLLTSNVTHATGEKYIWTSATTIEASGGKYTGKTTFSVTPQHQFSGSTTEAITTDMGIKVNYGCYDHTNGRIVIRNNDRTKGELWVDQLASGSTGKCGQGVNVRDSNIDMDPTFSIADQATPPPASGTDYNTKDCNTVTDAKEKAKCVAVKSCVTQHGKTAADCEAAWTGCISADQSDAALKACGDQIGKGDVSGAKYVAPPKAEEASQTNCKVDGIGWIICPVMRFMAKVTDQAYGIVSYMLTTPALSSDTNSPMYKAWAIMRNFANVAFVIAFLIVIYSQITGVGVSNYGIKKLLPRIIVAAILVNVSYWICAIAVDLSNILGSSLYGLLEGASNRLFVDGKSYLGSGGGGIWDALTVGIIGVAATVAILYAGLSVLLPILLAALVAIVVAVVALTLRQALIIILIVISPLAFVAYLLPNTESWYKKWRGLLQTLLLMFPIIAVIFGGSALASKIIMSTAGDNVVLQVMGAGITIIPLIVAPAFMKKAGDVLGKLGINDPSKGLVDRAKKGAAGYRSNRQQLRDARALNGGFQFGRGSQVKRNARRQAVLAQRERNVNNARSGYIAKASLDSSQSATQQALAWATDGSKGGKTKGDQLVGKMAAGGGDAAKSGALAQALTIQNKLEAEEVTAASATIKALNLTGTQKRELAGGGEITTADGRKLNAGSDIALQRAAMQSVADTADIKGMNDLVDQSKGWSGANGDKLRQSLADTIGASGNRPSYMSQGNLEKVRQGQGKSSTEMIEEAIGNNTYSAEKIATTDKDELNAVAAVAAASTNVSVAEKQKLVNNAHEALTDDKLKVKVGKNLAVVQNIRTNTPPPPLT
jgi:hypothetical protein